MFDRCKASQLIPPTATSVILGFVKTKQQRQNTYVVLNSNREHETQNSMGLEKIRVCSELRLCLIFDSMVPKKSLCVSFDWNYS